MEMTEGPRAYEVWKESGQSFDNTKTIGTREEVWEGRAVRTKGGITREGLLMKEIRRNGTVYQRLVSKAASSAASRNNNLRLQKMCNQATEDAEG